MDDNFLLLVDSYKLSHVFQYPPNTEYVYSYIEARTGGRWNDTLFFGLQAYLQRYLAQPITAEMIDEAEAIWHDHGEPFFRAGWEHILTAHRGRLPVLIRAVAEGTVLATGNVLVSIVNTDPACWWLPSFLETALLRAVWYPTSVATNSFHCKLEILDGLLRSSDDPLGQITFKLHDFGGRGVSSHESAGLGGAGHLVNFRGTDTIEAVMAVRHYYDEPMAGFSIPASEHSTMTAWGRDGEIDAYRNMLRRFGRPGKMFAVVSDSYDIEHAVRDIWGGVLRDEVINSGATVVIRPDSGPPVETSLRVLNWLADSFGVTSNRLGYKVLPPCVRMIYGDGINQTSIGDILTQVLRAKFSADNIAFGAGGALLQQVDRDTLRFAMKTSAICSNGVWREVWKEPKGAPEKASKRGRLTLVRQDGQYRTVPQTATDDLLIPVFENGRLLHRQHFADIRDRAHGEAVRRVGLGLAA